MTYGDYEIKNGHLYISGADSVELAKEYSTPLYVMSEDVVRASCRELKGALDKYYESNGLITYASKALCIKEMCRIIDSEGLGLDAVSGGELCTAKAASFPMEKVNYHGNNKTDEEIRMGISFGVGRFVVDNKEELIRIDKIADELGKVQKVLLRITPGVDAHTHSFVKTGQIDSKFGSAIQTGAADDITDFALTLENIQIAGFHCHIGSQIFEQEPFVEAARVMLDFIDETEARTACFFTDLVLGGGFGIKYTEEDKPLSYDEILRPVLTYVKAHREKVGKKLIHLGFEPGRSIAGPAGTTLYTVGSVKEIPNIRTYVSVDGGMTDNPRYMLYGSKYTFIIANRADKKKDNIVTVCGKCCESGDMLGEGVELSEVHAGDILAVTSTGAYNYSMASNYNRIPRPAMVFVKNGEARLAVRRETYEEMCERDI
ncbi:MAG: diaminopimelate decarboxylase [Clostridia bacterium]|nr:diaminopimelate decarboxylase [Clostridia bacterium]